MYWGHRLLRVFNEKEYTVQMEDQHRIVYLITHVNLNRNFPIKIKLITWRMRNSAEIIKCKSVLLLTSASSSINTPFHRHHHHRHRITR